MYMLSPVMCFVQLFRRAACCQSLTSFRHFHVKWLLEKKADANKRLTDRPGNNETALHLAARSKSVECMRLLIENHADVNAVNNLKETPLHLGVASRTEDSLACVRLLLEAGCNVTLRDVNSYTALHLAAVTASPEIVELLCESKADPQETTDKQWTPLHLAAYKNNAGIINTLLTGSADEPSNSGKSDLSAVNDRGQTALHLAVKIKHDFTDSVKLILQHDKDKAMYHNSKLIVNKKDKRGRTALHVAIQHGNLKCVQEILNSGAGIDIQDIDGSTPLHELLRYQEQPGEEQVKVNFKDECLKKLIVQGGAQFCRDNTKATPLHIAALYDYSQKIAILYNDDVGINVTDANGLTPLHMATLNGCFQFVQELIEKKANVNAKDNRGRTALYMAIASQNRDCVEVLLNSDDIDVDAMTKDRMTAVHEAVLKSDVDGLRQLIKKEANLNVEAKEGWRPIHIAAIQNDAQCLKLLVKNGARDAPIESHFSALEIAKQNNNATCVQILEECDNKGSESARQSFPDLVMVSLSARKQEASPKSDLIRQDSGANIVPVGPTNQESHEAKMDCDLLLKNPTVQDKSGDTALHKEAFRDHIEHVRQILSQHSDVDFLNRKNTFNKTALHMAAENGHHDIVTVLLKAAGDNASVLESKDETNSTALHRAAEGGHAPCVTALLENATSLNNTHYVNIKNDSELTALHLAVANNNLDCVKILVDFKAEIIKGDRYSGMLHMAVEKGNHSCLRYLLMIEAVEKPLLNMLLHWAAKTNSHKCVAILLEYGADIHARNKNNMTALLIAMDKRCIESALLLLQQMPEEKSAMLQLAAQMGDPAMVKALLGDKQVDVNWKDENGLTALHQASFFGHDICVEILLEGNATVSKDNNGLTPLHYSARAGRLKCLALLLGQRDRDFIDWKDALGLSALHNAAKKGHIECLKVLMSHGADKDSQDEKHATPVHSAAREEKTECLKLLINAGANVNNLTRETWTALHYAAKCGHHSCVDVLVQAGADVNVRTKKCFTALRFAAGNGHKECVKALLCSPDIDVNMKCDKNLTALHVAAMNDSTEIIELLLDNGANVTLKDEYNSMPLHRAVMKDAFAAMEILLLKGKAPVNAKDTKGYTPLLMAAKRKYYNSMKVLIKHNANLNCVTEDTFRNTPLHEVVGINELKCAKLLIDSGADLTLRNENRLTPSELAKQRGFKNLKLMLEEAEKKSES